MHGRMTRGGGSSLPYPAGLEWRTGGVIATSDSGAIGISGDGDTGTKSRMRPTFKTSAAETARCSIISEDNGLLRIQGAV